MDDTETVASRSDPDISMTVHSYAEPDNAGPGIQLRLRSGPLKASMKVKVVGPDYVNEEREEGLQLLVSWKTD